MLSKRFPADTLFIIMEEDFQFYDVAAERMSAGTAVAEPSAATARAGGAASSSRVPEPSAGTREQYGGGRMVDDLVKLCTASARAGVGDLVWFSYVPDKAETKENWSQPRFAFGSAGIALNKTAAASIATCFNSGFWKANHIDMELKKWCVARIPEQARCCWIFPPIGNFNTHESECCFSQAGIRSSHWQRPWCTPGTRPSDDKRSGLPKSLYRFVPSGYQVLVSTVQQTDFEDWSLWWNSYWQSPPDPEATTGRQQRELRRQRLADCRRWYVEEAKEAPVTPAIVAFRPRETMKNKPKPVAAKAKASGSQSQSQLLLRGPPPTPQPTFGKYVFCLGPVSLRRVADHRPSVAEAKGLVRALRGPQAYLLHPATDPVSPRCVAEDPVSPRRVS